jgi:beta-N-acetylhexosaminidase
MAQHGVNVNLAPVVDIKGTTPGLGAIQRCFAADPATITRHARWWIDEHHHAGVLCTLKHFPGHGSAVDDSHWGFVDVTNTWHESELEPYRMLTEQGLADMVMTAHIMNSKLDAEYPATLSKKVLQGLLRDTLHFDGVVVTDDMYMQAIIDKYSIENAIVLAINAGADMLCVGNNISTGYEPDRPFRLVGMIVAAVKDGRIPLERLLEAHERITRLQNKLSQLNN